jgi:translation initiation factor 5B
MNVLSDDGQYHKVVIPMSREYSGDMIKIKPGGLPFIEVTPEHPILTTKGWKPAGELSTADLLISPKSLKTEDVKEITLNLQKYPQSRSARRSRIKTEQLERYKQAQRLRKGKTTYKEISKKSTNILAEQVWGQIKRPSCTR